MYRAKIPKREKPDQTIYTSHDSHGPAQIARDWSKESKITVVSIDPGIVNLGFRIERRNYKGSVMEVEVLAYANAGFGDYQTDLKTGVSSLYRMMKNFMRKYDKFLNDINLVIV